MRLIFLLAPLLILLPLAAQDEGPLYSDQTKKSFAQELKTTSSGAMETTTKQAVSQMANDSTKSVMIIDPKMISQDWIDAFRLLSGKRITEIVFTLGDQSTISNVTDIDSLPGGYLMLFTLKTVQGPRYQIIKTSDITTLSTR